MTLRDFLARWYMRRVAGRYCPCEWPVKVKWLMHLCGRIDDAASRAEGREWARVMLPRGPFLGNQTTSATEDIKVKWKVEP